MRCCSLNNPTVEPRPTTDLDLQQGLTDPFISSPYVDESLKDKFKEYEYIKDENGKVKVYLKRDLWTVLNIFTRDWRLGNIDKKEEAVYIRHFLDLTTDIITVLGDDFRESAIISLERAFAVNETSQSKGGFLRRLLNTFIHQTNKTDDDTKKRSLFGLGKKTN